MQPQLHNLKDLATRVARLNPDASAIGAGMLANLVALARTITGHAEGHTDVMRSALDALDTYHGDACRNLSSRADELLTIQHALAPLLDTGGLRITRTDPGNDGNAPLLILGRIELQPTEYLEAMCALRAAGLECHTANMWRHVAPGWHLALHWPDLPAAQSAARQISTAPSWMPA